MRYLIFAVSIVCKRMEQKRKGVMHLGTEHNALKMGDGVFKIVLQQTDTLGKSFCLIGVQFFNVLNQCADFERSFHKV